MTSNTPLTVLLADDDLSFRETLRTYLSGCGFRVLTAGDARTAFAVGREHSLDFVVLDLGLPHLDLQWFMNLVREGAMTPDVQVVIITGAGGAQLAQWTRSLGVSLHLVKSTFSMARLASMLRRLIGSPPPRIPAEWNDEAEAGAEQRGAEHQSAE